MPSQLDPAANKSTTGNNSPARPSKISRPGFAATSAVMMPPATSVAAVTRPNTIRPFEDGLVKTMEAGSAATIKTPPATTLIKKAIKLDKGSKSPLTEKVGKITRAQLEEIAKTKLKDMNASDIEAAIKTLAGSARSMGVTVEGV